MPEELLRCFVISPIGAIGSDTRLRADKILSYVIKPAAADEGFAVERADEIAEPGLITRQIVERLIDADVVIADLAELNPNVFYELALRHAAKKAAIHLYEDETGIPFDVQDVRSIRISTDVEVATQAVAQLRLMLAHVREHPDEEVESPFTQGLAFALKLAAASDDPAEQDIVRDVARLNDRVDSVERRLASPAARASGLPGFVNAAVSVEVDAPDRVPPISAYDFSVIVEGPFDQRAASTSVTAALTAGALTKQTVVTDADGVARFVAVSPATEMTVVIVAVVGSKIGNASVQVRHD